MVGLCLGHYRIIAKIGAGGMGEVYRAHDEQLDRDVALKVLPAGVLTDETTRKRFRKEALALASLNHPNIETVYEFGSHDGVDILVMELIPGPTLRERLRTGPLPEREVLRLGVELAEGLTAAHEQGIVHRDLKPGNIIVMPNGHVKVLDFGLAKLLRPTSDAMSTENLMETHAAGTLPYMAPEQLRDEPVDSRTDVYAAGAVLYEMATGQRPHTETQSARLIDAILHGTLTLPSTHNHLVTPALEGIILKALETESERRYQSARELRVALESVAAGFKPQQLQPDAPLTSGVMRPAALLRQRKIMVSTVALGLLGIVMSVWLLNTHKTHALSETDTIVLADISNSTGDTVFDETLKQALSVQLAQSPFLNILSDQRVAETLRLMGRSSGDRVTKDLAQKVCERTESKAMLSGSISSMGSQYVIGLNAIDCNTGGSLAQDQVQAARKEDVLKALDKATIKLREKLGESLSTIQKFDKPVELVSTPSLEALKAYSLGMKARNEKGDVTAISFFKHAIELDPNFAIGYAELGISYDNLGEPGLASMNTKKAFELRDRVSEREKFRISSAYYGYVTGELEKEMETYELWAQSYPRDAVPHLDLSADFGYLGQYDKAISVAREAVRLDPNNAVNYENLTGFYLALGSFEEVKSTFRQAQALKLENPGSHLHLYGVAFLEGDTAEMERQVAWAVAKRGAEDLLLSAQSDTEAYHGRLGKAREYSRRATELAGRNEQIETAALWKMNSALREVEFGNVTKAQQETASALTLAKSRDVQVLAALVLARSGDPRSQKMIDELQEGFRLNTVLNRYWLPTIRAVIEDEHGNPSKALEFLEGVGPFEMGQPPPLAEVGGFFYPVYVRGQEYLRLHQGSEAAAEFQKFLDHRGTVVNNPLGALAHLGLARAYTLQGHTAKARAAYQDFLTLWKHADPDIPILQQANAEYAKLITLMQARPQQ
jgi:eukaryotic-like serine/threonine-protein kinase